MFENTWDNESDFSKSKRNPINNNYTNDHVQNNHVINIDRHSQYINKDRKYKDHHMKDNNLQQSQSQ